MRNMRVNLPVQLSSSIVQHVGALFAATVILAGSLSPVFVTPKASAATMPANFPKISFTFDDGLASAVTKAAPTLAQNGLVGTDYVITGCVGMTTVPNTCRANQNAVYMTWNQVHQLQQQYGWEIGSHTVTHPQMALADGTKDGSLTGGAAQVESELSQSKATFAAEGINTTDFAWPYGDYDNAALADAAKYYATTRGFADVDGNTLAAPVANNSTVASGSYAYDDMLLHDQQFQESPAAPTYQMCSVNGTLSIATAETCIDNAIANNQWLVLVFHNITDTPDTVLADSSYDTSTTDLNTIAAYAAAKQKAGLAKVVTINQGVITGTNLLPNGEFADGIADGWTTDDTTNITLDKNNNGRYPNPQNAISLKSASNATATTTTHLFSPKVTITSGTTYDLKNYLNMLNGGSVDFYIDEYNSAGQWISGVDPAAGMTYAASGVDVGDVDFSYTPSSANVASASLQVIVKGTNVNAFYSGVQWFIPSSTAIADTTPPTTPGTPSAAALTSNKQPSVSWTASIDSDSGLANPAYTLEWSQDATFTTIAGQVTTNNTTATPNVALADGTWYFRVLAADQAGNVATSAVSYAVVIDTTAPVVSGVATNNITPTTANLSWLTSEPSTSQVIYGASINYGSSSTDSTLTMSHSISLSGLSANTTYHYEIISIDAAGNISTTNDATFKTALPGDVNHDGVVNDSDAYIMFAHWGPVPTGTTSICDLNHDGVVNDSDAYIMFANWSK